MPFKDLLLVAGKDTQAGNRYALDLARNNGANLTVTAFAGSPNLPAFLRSEMPGELLNRMREEAEVEARAALDAVAESARQSGITVDTVMPNLARRDVGGAISGLARHFDATVIQQPDPEGPDTSDLLEAVLFGSGRPVLVAPAGPGRSQIGTILIAWDEGRHAARAVADALPLLALAGRVEVVTIGSTKADRNWRVGNMVRHLDRHGIEAHMTSLVSEQPNVASTILSHAAAVDADLIVMGGYGHSRLREIVLGGTTRTVLQTMTVPVLMAH